MPKKQMKKYGLKKDAYSYPLKLFSTYLDTLLSFQEEVKATMQQCVFNAETDSTAKNRNQYQEVFTLIKRKADLKLSKKFTRPDFEA